MAVNRDDLNDPEQGMDLTTRDPKGAKKVAEDIQRVKKGAPPVETELRELRERIADVKSTPPRDEAPHCRDCFDRGARAALAAIEGVTTR